MSSAESSPIRVKVEKMESWDVLEGTSSLDFNLESWDEGDGIETLLKDFEEEDNDKDPVSRAQALIDHLDSLVKLEGYEQGWYGGEEKTQGLLLECLDGVVPAQNSYGWEQPTPPDSPPIPPQVDCAEYLQTITELNEFLTSGKPVETVEHAYHYAYPEAVPVAQPLDGYASSSPGYNSASSSGYNGLSSPGYSSDSNASSDASSDPDWSVPQRSTSSHRNDKYAVTATDDRKMRKKEQNKNAATRYRMKKKQQQQEILGEEKDLQDTNTSLREKVTDLKREMKYLKSLLRDVYRKKGLIR